MRFSNLLAVSLLLLSPVALLLSYVRQQTDAVEPTAIAPTQPNQAIPSPSPSLSPPGIVPLPPRRNRSLQAEDYLPPVRARRSAASPPLSPNGLPQTRLPPASSSAIGAQVERSLRSQAGASLSDGVGDSWQTGDLSALLAKPNGALPNSALRAEVIPPSAAMMAMTPPASSQLAASATLDNPTSAVFAQDGSNQLRQELLIEPLAPTSAGRRLGRVIGAPAISLSTPSGYGASFGQVFAGLSVVNRGRNNNNADASATVGFGLGDPRRAVGLDVAANVISLSDSGGRDSFAGSGNVGFKLHRILPGEVAVAVGWENALAWGDARNADSSVYGAVSRAFPLQPNNYRNPMPLVLSVGAGGGRFRSEQAIRNREGGVGLFASAGLQLSPQFSLLANWTGQDLNVGASFIPFPEIPFSLTLSAADLTGSAGDGARFALGLGYGTRFNF